MDKVEDKVETEFTPILENCEELELLSEEKLPHVSKETTEKSVNLFLELLNELRETYERFLEEVRPIAGEIAGSSEVGKECLKKLKKGEDLLEELKIGLEELKELLSDDLNEEEVNPEKRKLEAIEGDYINLINKKSKNAQKFFSQEMYSLIEKLKKEAERLESYYT